MYTHMYVCWFLTADCLYGPTIYRSDPPCFDMFTACRNTKFVCQVSSKYIRLRCNRQFNSLLMLNHNIYVYTYIIGSEMPPKLLQTFG